MEGYPSFLIQLCFVTVLHTESFFRSMQWFEMTRPLLHIAASTPLGSDALDTRRGCDKYA